MDASLENQERAASMENQCAVAQSSHDQCGEASNDESGLENTGEVLTYCKFPNRCDPAFGSVHIRWPLEFVSGTQESEFLDIMYSHILVDGGRPLSPPDLKLPAATDAFLESGPYRVLSPQLIKAFLDDDFNSDQHLVADSSVIPGFRMRGRMGKKSLHFDIDYPYLATPSFNIEGEIKALQLHHLESGKIASTKWATTDRKWSWLTKKPLKVDKSPHFAGQFLGHKLAPGGELRMAIGLIAADILAFEKKVPVVGLFDKDCLDDLSEVIRFARVKRITVYYGLMQETEHDAEEYAEALLASGLSVVVKEFK